MIRNATLVALLLALAITSACTAGDASSPRARPNILIIVTDDQRARGTLRVLPKTLRWFRDGGVRFSNGFATTPQCCPSRASIFTGRYSHNHGVLRNTRGWGQKMRQDTTIQRYLKDEGYLTGFFGKYLNNWSLSEEPPHFDRWALFSSGRGATYYDGGEWNVQGKVVTISQYYTSYIGRQAVQFLTGAAETDDDRPWALFLWPTAPHSPYQTLPRYEHAPLRREKRNPAQTEKSLADKPPYLRGRGSSEEVVKRQEAHLRALMPVDDMVQTVFRALGRVGEREDTLAFFTSDNGYLWGEHRFTGKNLPYSESVEVPMLLRWPGHVAERRVNDSLVANIDIAPTVLDAAGIDPPRRTAMDGVSLIDLLDGDRRRRKWLLLEHFGVEGKAIPSWDSIRTESEQYIQYYDEAGDVSFRERYDLRRDPWQLRNLLADSRLIGDSDVDRFQRQIKNARSCKGEGCP